MPDTTPAVVDPSAPSELLTSVLFAVSAQAATAAGMTMMMRRQADFPSPLAAQLTGIALDPPAHDYADDLLDTYWSNEGHRQYALGSGHPGCEVIIGSGFHAAVYAAVRVLSGHPRPLVLERAERAGGTFAITKRPTWNLNSRNRAGVGGLPRDRMASLNYLPGAPIQASNVSMADYQSNADMAFVIRLSLAQFADVVTSAPVQSVTPAGAGLQIQVADRADPIRAGRVIDARGIGDPTDSDSADGATILTFPQFMQRMAGPWPLRGLRRVAVIGGGDAGKCAVESLLGLAPPPFMAATTLDRVDRIDWYTDGLPLTCKQWQEDVSGRYQGIGPHLTPDRFGLRRLTIIPARALRPVALLGRAQIGASSYDLAIACTGNRERSIEGLTLGSEYALGDGPAVARKIFQRPVFRVGPHARLPFTEQEVDDGIADNQNNADAMFRTAGKTAVLAASLDALTSD